MLGKCGLGSRCHGLFKPGTSLQLGPRGRLWEKTHLGAAPSRKTQGGSTFHHVKSFSKKYRVFIISANPCSLQFPSLSL